MKSNTTLFFFALLSTAHSWHILPKLDALAHPFAPRTRDQAPMMPETAPKADHAAARPEENPQGPLMLSDVMGRDRSINVFAGFTRAAESSAERLNDAARNTTVLAPVNSAIEALPRKPWEDPRDYKRLGAEAYEGDDGQERAQKNLLRFVEEHMVPASPWAEGEKVKPVAGGREVWWVMKDGVRRIQPDDIEVTSISSTVTNGEVWIIKGVRNYAKLANED